MQDIQYCIGSLTTYMGAIENICILTKQLYEIDPKEVHIPTLIQSILDPVRHINEMILKNILDSISLVDKQLNAANTLDYILAPPKENTDIFLQYLYMHTKLVMSYQGVDKRGIRYPHELKNFYVLFASLGEYAYNMLHKLLLFPHFRWAQRRKEKLKREYQIETKDIHDGNNFKIDYLIQKLWIPKIPEKTQMKATIAVDACSISPNVRISKIGATGLLTDVNLTIEEITQLMEDETAFSNFVKEQQENKNIANYIFTYYLIPWINGIPSIPMLFYPSGQGNANNDTIDILNQLRHAKIDDVSIKLTVSDGDPSYLKLIVETISKFENIMKNTNSENNLISIAHQIIEDSNAHSFDLLHLLKNAWYRFASNDVLIGATAQSTPFELDKALLELGIPEFFMNLGADRKMDDRPALEIFSIEYVICALNKSDFNTFISLVGPTIYKEAFMNNSITKEKRIELLSIGLMYFFYYKQSLKKNAADRQGENKEYRKNFLSENKNASSSGITTFTNDMCNKYMAIALVTLDALYSEIDLNLAALTTHLLEHFFGKQRRNCKFDHRLVHFLDMASDSILYSIIESELHLELHQKSRVSDSGAHVQGTFKLGNIPNLFETLSCVYRFFKISSIPVIFIENQQHIPEKFHQNVMFRIEKEMKEVSIAAILLLLNPCIVETVDFKPTTTKVSTVNCITQKKNFKQQVQFKEVYTRNFIERRETRADPDYVDVENQFPVSTTSNVDDKLSRAAKQDYFAYDQNFDDLDSEPQYAEYSESSQDPTWKPILTRKH